MAWLIDSSIFIALDRRDKSWRSLESISLSEPVALASITASELLVGVHRATTELQRAKRRHFVETVLSDLPVLPFDVDTARTHARLFVEMTMMGRKIGSHDLIIAATAQTHGYAVFTHNVRHFEQVPRLRVRQANW